MLEVLPIKFVGNFHGQNFLSFFLGINFVIKEINMDKNFQPLKVRLNLIGRIFNPKLIRLQSSLVSKDLDLDIAGYNRDFFLKSTNNNKL